MIRREILATEDMPFDHSFGVEHEKLTGKKSLSEYFCRALRVDNQKGSVLSSPPMTSETPCIIRPGKDILQIEKLRKKLPTAADLLASDIFSDDEEPTLGLSRSPYNSIENSNLDKFILGGGQETCATLPPMIFIDDPLTL